MILRAPPLEDYLAARIINNALHPPSINEELPTQPVESLIGLDNISRVTANYDFVGIPKQRRLDRIFQYHRDPKGLTWEEYSKDMHLEKTRLEYMLF